MKSNPLTAPQDLAAVIEMDRGAGQARRRWLIAGAIVLAGSIALAMTRAGSSGNTSPQFVTAPVERGDLRVVVTATGNLEPTNKVTVGSELSGTALEVLVDSNDRVTKGQPLARLDTRKLVQQMESSRAALASAKAKVFQAKATVVEKQATLRRAQELQRISGGKVPSKADMDTAVAAADRAQADLASAEAAVDEAKAQLETNQTDLTKATLAAPIDGTVLTRSLEPGQTVAASFTAPELFVIAENLDRMKLKVSVAEADIGGVKEGQVATFTVDAWPDRAYSAKVTKVAFGSTVTDNVVTYKTELEVANEDLSLRPGMTATVDIGTDEALKTLLVPSAALRFEPAVESVGTSKNGPPQKSFLQRIVPGPPPGNAKRKSADDATAPERKKTALGSHVWLLRDGRPVSVAVKAGLSNGRFTEVSGPDLAEGIPVIIRASTATP